MARPGVVRAADTLLRHAISRSACGSGLRVSIDNLDGSDARDYSAAVLADADVRMERALNAPSTCAFDLLVTPDGLPVPARRGRVVVSDGEGAVLFTGYLATEPVREYVGGDGSDISYRVKVNAISDEWLLDKLGPASPQGDGLSLGLDAREVLARLLARVGGDVSSFAVVGSGVSGSILGTLNLAATATWSVAAGAAATSAYAAYRAVNSQILLQRAGTVVHAIGNTGGTLVVADFRAANVGELANDVTVSGAEEPTAFVTELLTGDGTTSDFALHEPAFRGNHRQLLQDSFALTTVDTSRWFLDDPASHLSVTAAGLTMNGGNGVDGDTTLTALDAIEMSGSVVVEMRGVRLSANSDGMLGGMYEGPTVLATCFAGFRVQQSGGVVVIVPVVSGAEVGTAFTALAEHSYTLRLRLHCVEMQRAMQRYLCMVDGTVQTFGSASGVSAPMDITFELVDEGAASNTPATVLYDSAASGRPVAVTPATCAFVAVNSTHLFGSVASVSVARPGSMWVVSTLSSGAKQTRLIGGPNEGADCSASYGNAASGPGKVSFFAGRVPVEGERIAVLYRTTGRAVARVADAASVAAEAAAGVSGTSRWLGKVLQPPARSSVDCESAAKAILAFATSRSAAIAGTYTCVNPAADVWPGDVLSLTSAGVTTALLVRSVEITAQQESVRYKIAFANDWATELADGLGIKLSEAIAKDSILPPGADNAEPLANLQSMQVVSVSGTTLQIDAGVDAPTGGGFEVRRRDNAFGLESGVDLVLRSPVRSISIPRGAQLERFFVRMYDASVPPRYSRFSSAVFVNVPLGS